MRRRRAVVSSHHQEVADVNFTIEGAGRSNRGFITPLSALGYRARADRQSALNRFEGGIVSRWSHRREYPERVHRKTGSMICFRRDRDCRPPRVALLVGWGVRSTHAPENRLLD